MFSKITFLKSGDQVEKNEVCLSFLEEFFTKSVHRGGVSVEKLVNCYNFLYPGSNVFMAVNTTAVEWGRWSVIEADLTCMEQLLNLNSQ